MTTSWVCCGQDKHLKKLKWTSLKLALMTSKSAVGDMRISSLRGMGKALKVTALVGNNRYCKIHTWKVHSHKCLAAGYDRVVLVDATFATASVVAAFYLSCLLFGCSRSVKLI